MADDKFTRRTRSRVETEQQDPNTPANEQTLQMTPAEPIGTLQPNLGAVVADSNEENDPACEPLVSQICRQSTNSVLEFREYVYHNTSVSFGGVGIPPLHRLEVCKGCLWVKIRKRYRKRQF